MSQGCVINNFTVLDPEVNFSDHLPLLVDVTIKCTSPTCSGKGSSRDCRTSNTLSANQIQLRWVKLIAVHIFHWSIVRTCIYALLLTMLFCRLNPEMHQLLTVVNV